MESITEMVFILSRYNKYRSTPERMDLQETADSEVNTMSENTISGIINTVTDMLDGNDNTPQNTAAGTTASVQNGFSLLQPIMQNFLNNQPGDNGKVEDMDDDGIMDVITNLVKNVDFGSLIKHLDKDQISNIVAFVQEKFIRSSDDKKEQNTQGLGTMLQSLQAANIDTSDITNTLGTLMKAFQK